MKEVLKPMMKDVKNQVGQTVAEAASAFWREGVVMVRQPESLVQAAYAQSMMPEALVNAGRIATMQTVELDWLQVGTIALSIIIGGLLAGRNKLVKVIPGDQITREYISDALERSRLTIVRQDSAEEVIKLVRVGRNIRIVPPPGVTIKMEPEDHVQVVQETPGSPEPRPHET